MASRPSLARTTRAIPTTEVIPATGHDYDDGVVTTEPTYTENGVKTFTCHNCGDTYTESIPALGYTYNETVVAPTCTEDGYTMHECVEDATKSFKDNIVPALGHEYKGKSLLRHLQG